MRYVIAIAGLLAVVAALGSVKFLQISTLIGAASAAQKAGAPPETVAVAPAKQEVWDATLKAVGDVAAARGVILSNDSPGIVTGIYFESGATVKAGQVLVAIDHSVERAQLASARAREELAAANAGRSRSLIASGVVPKSQLENDEAMLLSSGADRGALQAQIARKIVRAPFSGKLGIRQVNLGQYLSPGTPVAVLEAADSVFVDFTLPQQQVAEISLGMPVRVNIAGLEGGPFTGTLQAIDPAVDGSTRTLKLRAGVDNVARKLLPGMYAEVEVVLPKQQTIVTVPLTALLRASYGDSVFLAEASEGASGGKGPRVARQQFVRTGAVRGDFVAILEGINPGQDVVTAGAFKLRNGARIVVNNDVQPTAELAPRPPNR